MIFMFLDKSNPHNPHHPRSICQNLDLWDFWDLWIKYPIQLRQKVKIWL